MTKLDRLASRFKRFNKEYFAEQLEQFPDLEVDDEMFDKIWFEDRSCVFFYAWYAFLCGVKYGKRKTR